MYVVILNYECSTTDIILYTDIADSDSESFNLEDWVHSRYGTQTSHILCDYLNIEI